MKNWKVILWLIAFYPIGIYNMFKCANWPNGVKYTITAFLAFVTWQMISIGELYGVLMISGASVLLIGLTSIIINALKRKDKRTAIGILFLGILLFSFSYPQVEKENAIQEQKQQLLIKEQEKEKRLSLVKEATTAVEFAEKEKNRITYKKADDLVEKLNPKNLDLANRLITIDTYLTKEENLKEATLALEKAEKDKNQENYEIAASLIDTTDLEGTDLKERLENVKKFIDTEKLKTEQSIIALDSAEESKKREDYDKANTLISELALPNQELTTRLGEVETIITVEETRIAVEKEEQAKIAAKKEEDARIAEKQEQDRIASEEAEKNRLATVNANNQNTSEQPKVNTEQPAPSAPVNVNTVYITKSGSKYHSRTDCRGLNNSNSTRAATMDEALGRNLDPCSICW